MKHPPTATDLKVFVPCMHYENSLAYYTALGCEVKWKSDDLSEMELGGQRFYLQNYYNRDWANNFMIYVDVDSAREWFDHITQVLADHSFKYARVKPPKVEPHAIVTYAWDPSGVLLHFAEDHPADE
ncbi:MAG: hypothetical protein R3301_15995 [Saprospiraceae bacterium]|nr:hypothetical protein [Saprospiraceae bacterium]